MSCCENHCYPYNHVKHHIMYRAGKAQPKPKFPYYVSTFTATLPRLKLTYVLDNLTSQYASSEVKCRNTVTNDYDNDNDDREEVSIDIW